MRMTWLEAIALGIVQGITEFLPVSSDGHLNITEKLFSWWSGHARPPDQTIFFFVMLHVGTLAAILVYYRDIVREIARSAFAPSEPSARFGRKTVVRAGVLAAVATLPLVPDKLIFMPYIERAFEGTAATGVGFLITAMVLLATMRMRGGSNGPLETTWLDALLVGVAQAFAPLPGVSRSGLTIAAALALGFERAWAVGFSLLIAVPAILGATVFELKEIDRATMTPQTIRQTIAATVVAGVVGFMAIRWLVRVVRAGKLWLFAVYLVALGALILGLAFMPGARGGARDSRAYHGTIRLEPAVPVVAVGERGPR